MARGKRGGRGRGRGRGGGTQERREGDGGPANEPEPQTWEVRPEPKREPKPRKQQPQRKKGGGGGGQQPKRRGEQRGRQQPRGGGRGGRPGRLVRRRGREPMEQEGPPPIPVTDGVKLESNRAAGRTWWSRKWVATLEIMGYSGRLERGFEYARAGQVLGFHIIPATVVARVQGSQPRPYEVAMKFRPLTDEEWERVYEAMSSRAAFAASLLAGEMPREIDEAFRKARVRLFPEAGAQDMETLCSCPDAANPCKHIAAVHYILAQEFDKDPFLLFLLRGRTRDQVTAALRERRATAAASTAPAEDEEREPDTAEAVEAPIPTDPDAYFKAAPELMGLSVRLEAPARPHAIPHRLGRPSFWPDQVDYETWARAVYAAASRRAMARALAEEAANETGVPGEPEKEA